jgi:hypothetical protein
MRRKGPMIESFGVPASGRPRSLPRFCADCGNPMSRTDHGMKDGIKKFSLACNGCSSETHYEEGPNGIQEVRAGETSEG